jgi:hypothetical protein
MELARRAGALIAILASSETTGCRAVREPSDRLSFSSPKAAGGCGTGCRQSKRQSREENI